MGPGSAPNARRNVRTIVVAILLASSAATVGIGLTAAGAASATPTGVDECTTIDEAGSYELTTDLGTGPEVSTTCIRITASDVTFDGNGHTVGAPDALPNDTFLVADGPGELRNVTLRDVRIRGDAPTVRFGNVTGARIANVSVTSTDRERPYTPGRIRVTGDGNTITGTTGFVSLSVIGDDNRVVDAETSGNYERRSLSVDGDRNLVGNLSVTGGTAVVSGADNRVANSALGFIAGRGGLRFENATDPVLINSSATGVELEHTTARRSATTTSTRPAVPDPDGSRWKTATTTNW